MHFSLNYDKLYKFHSDELLLSNISFANSLSYVYILPTLKLLLNSPFEGIELTENISKYGDSLNEIYQDSFENMIKELTFLNNRDKPNLLLFGKPEKGKELLSVLIGRAACKKGYKTNFIRYEYLLDILRGDGYFDPKHEPYKTLAKSECLIIDDFAGTIERDKMVISELQRFFRFRQANHLNGTGKKRRPHSTIFLSYYPFHKWNDYLADEDEKACYFKSMIEDHGTMIKVDDSVEYQTLESRFWY